MQVLTKNMGRRYATIKKWSDLRFPLELVSLCFFHFSVTWIERPVGYTVSSLDGEFLQRSSQASQSVCAGCANSRGLWGAEGLKKPENRWGEFLSCHEKVTSTGEGFHQIHPKFTPEAPQLFRASAWWQVTVGILGSLSLGSSLGFQRNSGWWILVCPDWIRLAFKRSCWGGYIVRPISLQVLIMPHGEVVNSLGSHSSGYIR